MPKTNEEKQAEIMEAVAALIEDGEERTAKQVAAQTGYSETGVRCALHELQACVRQKTSNGIRAKHYTRSVASLMRTWQPVSRFPWLDRSRGIA